MFFRRRKGAGKGAPDTTRGGTAGVGGAAGGGAAGGLSAEGAAALAAAGGDATTTQFLTGDSRADRRSVEVLLGAIARVSQARDVADLESVLGYIVETSIETFGAERGILVLETSTGELDVRVARLRGGAPADGDLRFSTSVVRRVIENQEPVRATVTSESEALELGTSVFDLKLRAVMCVPLTTHDGGEPSGGRGALYVDSKAAAREFRHEDLALFAALSQHIAIALQNAKLHLSSIERAKLEQSLEIASSIQSGLMPQVPRDLPGWDVHGWYKPAERTSGDFYDFVRTKGGRFGVVVGDVTGHGIGPALITATAQASLRSYLRVLEDPRAVVTMLNQDLGERTEDDRFLTLFLALLSDDGSVHALNAGATPPLVWRAAEGRIDSVRGTGPALGMAPDFEFDEGVELRLEPGDTLVAFTDGLVEARRPDTPDHLFGEEGMRRVVAEQCAAGASARALTEALVQAVLEFSGTTVLEDDMTVVAVRRRS